MSQRIGCLFGSFQSESFMVFRLVDVCPSHVVGGWRESREK